MSGIVFAQDTGTGLSNQDKSDWIDAANLMGSVHSDNVSQYKVSGLNVTVDYGIDEATISPGQAKIKLEDISTVDHIGDGTKEISNYQWDEVTVSVLFNSDETVGISSSGITEIYIDSSIDSSDPDQAEIVTAEPTSGGLKIAEIDADSQEVDENYNVYSDVYHNEIISNRISEPSTPSSGESVRWFDQSEESYKMKFDNGNTITIAEK